MTPTLTSDEAAAQMLRILPLLHHTVSALSLLSHEVKDLRPALQGHQDATIKELCQRLTLIVGRMSPPAEAARLTPTASQPAVGRGFPEGARVRKVSGSSWQGRVVGFYSTDQTPDGICVESEREPGSVQIYPAKALALLDPRDDDGAA